MLPSKGDNERPTTKGGFFLKYKDYKLLEKLIEEYNMNEKGDVDFNEMSDDEKQILFKIKTVIRNMENVRLRTKE